MQLFVNDLTVIDCSYLCPERGIVGESWIVDIVLDGALNEQSMVLDFGRVKKQVKAIIDNSVDHKLVVPAEHPYTKVTHNSDDSANWVDFVRPEQRSIHLFCPADAFAFIDAEVVSIETVTDYLKAVIKRELPVNVEGLSLFLRPENIDGFYYHYTHGLKKHDGNCQRIAHGHRSKIQIKLDNIRQPVLEKEWSDKWQDIYLGTTEDVCTRSNLQLSGAASDLSSDSSHTFYSYTADQGLFELVVPNAENFVIDTDSTVECIADYLVEEIKSQNPDKKVEVRAFEGVGKGAIAYA
ncbi:6-carboxytetrahydropterin synthase [Idiomarina abyssalis]|uniref:6-carboxytetrahydropterin synthase n=1 Tax=Idiomarina abyssalis TaxID=86102 RepID=UPI0006C841B4|nr:6-carboxytetrahydropterin synthase [Idiomarina abyssalis]KPD22663.1 6-pyruvoyl tetrahydropterin synthase [Idiomarina abyssalis]SFT45170.1 6-pyruvoyl tetrahydropterin synthase [Idiomarina abyssalis]